MNPKSLKNLRHFKKGDPKINRKGAPKKAASLEDVKLLAQELLNCPVAKGGKKDGIVLTKILAAWGKSRNWQAQKALLEYGYGKLKETVDHNVKETLEIIPPVKTKDAENPV